jgi:hypothetical protein
MAYSLAAAAAATGLNKSAVLKAALEDMREQRDRWQQQAERLAGMPSRISDLAPGSAAWRADKRLLIGLAN